MGGGDDAMRSTQGGGGGGKGGGSVVIDSSIKGGGGGVGVGSNDNTTSSKAAKVKAFGAVAAWFSSTVVLISCNKVLMSEHFRLPVFLTFLHMIVSYAWCEFSAEMVRSAGEGGLRERG